MWAGPARALDTLSTYEPGGLTQFEAAVGYDRIGPGAGERHLHTAYLLGIGITDWFSGHYIGGGRCSEQLTDGETSHGFGVLLTPLDTYHFDLDLTADVGFAGRDRAWLASGFEVNVDGHPDQSGFGLFLQGGAHVAGRGPSLDGTLRPRRSLSMPYALGTYYGAADGHRVLLLVDFVSIPDPDPDERGFEVGNLALGYNVQVHDRVELQHEVLVDIPQHGEDAALGFWFGIKAATW